MAKTEAVATGPQTEKNLNFFDLCKYLDDGKVLYLRNNSRRDNGTINIVVVSYLTQEGGMGFNFPRTSLPVSICNYIEASALKQSSSFKKLYNKGQLQMVSEEDALKELSDEAAMASLEAAINEADNNGLTKLRAGDVEKSRQEERDYKASQDAEKAQGMQHIISALDPTLANLIAETKRQTAQENKAASANPRFIALEKKAREMDPDAQYGAFIGLYGELDVETLMKVATNSAWCEKVRKTAKKRMNDLMG